MIFQNEPLKIYYRETHCKKCVIGKRIIWYILFYYIYN